MFKLLLSVCFCLVTFSVFAASKGQFVQQRYPADTVVIAGAQDKALKTLLKSFEKQFKVKLKLKKSNVRGEASLYQSSRTISPDEQQDWESLAESSQAQVFFPLTESESRQAKPEMMRKKASLPTRSEVEK